VFRLFLLVLLAVPSAVAQLKIAAAADLQPVLPTLMQQFEKQTGAKVDASYASSATLATQILNGAPFSLFLAADLSFPQKVTAAGLAGAPVPYARGTLVLWARNDSPLQPLTLETLRNPALKTVAVANAEHAPYGRAARAAIETMGLTATLKDKQVVAENIAQTAQYAETGNAQVGLLSLTSALTAHLSQEGKYVVIPQEDYPPLIQGAVVIKNGADAKQAQQFLDFLLSAPVQQELAARGLRAP
jgi:molybdate transport system substrate-binding protein